jgi:protein-S-isoprenylcysteine O-methyltransferase Ste14
MTETQVRTQPRLKARYREEIAPALREQFGSSYEEYLGRVNRWVPMLSSRHAQS